MKSYATKDIRNVALIGATRAGKTTLAEAMLFEGKVIDRRGTVEGKNTVSDNTEFEQTNQPLSTPSSAAARSTSSTAPVPTISAAAPSRHSRLSTLP